MTSLLIKDIQNLPKVFRVLKRLKKGNRGRFSVLSVLSLVSGLPVKDAPAPLMAPLMFLNPFYLI